MRKTVKAKANGEQDADRETHAKEMVELLVRRVVDVKPTWKRNKYEEEAGGNT